MFLNRLNEEQKEQFLTLCNLLADKATKRGVCIKIIQEYCEEMEIPNLDKDGRILKQTAFKLNKNGGIIPVAILFALLFLRMETNGRDTWILNSILEFADMKESDEKAIRKIAKIMWYSEEYSFRTCCETLYSLLNEEQKKHFMILCNLYDKEPVIITRSMYLSDKRCSIENFMRDEFKNSDLSYWDEVRNDRKTFKQIAFDLTETSSQEAVRIIALELAPLAQLAEREEDLKHFLVYADIEEEKVMKFRTLNDRFTSIQNEIGFQKLYTLNEEQKVLVLSLCKFFIEKEEDELRIFDVYSRKMEINSVITGETPIKRVIFELAETGIDMETVCALALLPIWIKRETSGCHSFYGSTDYTADTDWMSDCLKYAGVDKAEFSAKYLDEDGLFHRLINVINEVYQEIGIKDYPQSSGN